MTLQFLVPQYTETDEVVKPLYEDEVWKDIKGYEGYYKISSYGRVYSFPRFRTKGGIVKHSFTLGGYPTTHLSKDGVVKSFLVHRLVATHFLENPNNYPEVNHKDECKTNNHVDNLEFCTKKYNENYGTKRERCVKSHDYKASAIKSAKNHDYKEVARKLAKPVLQLDLSGNIIKRWESGMEIQRQLNISNGNISSACHGKLKTTHGYRWMFEEDYQS